MARHLFLLCALLFAAVKVMAGGTVRGKVIDAATGEALIGASITVKGSSPPVGASANFDGEFSLTIAQDGPVVIAAVFFGYTTQELTVDLKGGEVVVLTFELEQAVQDLKEVVVVSKANKRTDVYLDRLKANAPASFDFISRDAIQRTGDGDASQAVKRVTGVSTVGAFVTVRGLADRYLVTAINGSRVPTLDPFTNNLRLDLFPTGLLDNIIITKTATPDLPGDWSGAYLSMNTSDYPQKFQLTVTSTLGYNPNSSFQRIVSAGTGASDRTGWDDGGRDVPAGVPSAVEDFPRFVDPTLYQQLGLLGLGDYLATHGIVSTTPGFSSTTMSTSSTLEHLALTQLGLLAPALLYDANAVQTAVDAYNSTYDLAYFSPTVNAHLADLNTRFDNSHWRVGTTTGAPNFNQAFTIGDQLDLFKKSGHPKQLGYLVGFRYATETQYDGSASFARTLERYDDANPGDQFKRKGDEMISAVSNGWNALGSLSFAPHPDHSFTLTAMGNVLGQNNARYVQFLDPTISGATFVSEDQFWEQRKLWVLQYSSKHVIPALKLTVTPDVSYSTGRRDILDMKTVQYVLPTDGGPIDDVDGALTPPGRIYRYLKEDLLESRLALETPLKGPYGRVRKLKFGGAYRWDQRTNDQKYFVVLDAPGPTQWEQPGRFELGDDGRFLSRYAPFGSFKDNDIGVLKVTAAYVMSDYAVTERLRLAGGVRVEHTDLVSDVYNYWQQHLAADDTARGTVGDLSINGALSPEPKPAIPGRILRSDVLPSINLIYRLRVDDQAPMNVRVSYFRSLGRPSFRELSVVQYYDYQYQAPIFGNPELRMTHVDNFDIRVERFLASGANISVSGFHKRFKDHIELLQTAAGGFTWRNADRSVVTGVELEGKVKLWRVLEWRGNLTWMDSRSELTTTIGDNTVHYTTPMFGQAPYIVNTSIAYTLDSLHLTFNASYNVQGPKLAVTNSEVDPDGIRAYEMPRNLVDLSVIKQFGKHWGVTLRVRDLLNAPIRRSYKFASGYDLDFDVFRYGTEYQLVLAYTIR